MSSFQIVGGPLDGQEAAVALEVKVGIADAGQNGEKILVTVAGLADRLSGPDSAGLRLALAQHLAECANRLLEQAMAEAAAGGAASTSYKDTRR